MLKSSSFDNEPEDFVSSGTCSPDEDFIEPKSVMNKINKKTKEKNNSIDNDNIKIKIRPNKTEINILNYEAKFIDFLKVDNIYA